mgnify:CR=1 FL=1
MSNSVSYIDSEEMQISFVSLIINVASINLKFGTLNTFIKTYNKGGVTNGKLYVLSEMSSPAYYLEKWVREKLIAKSFIYREDYVFLEEQLIQGVDNRPTIPINRLSLGTEKIKWLDSSVSEKGNIIWHKKTYEHSQFNNLKNSIELNRT